MSIWAAIVGTVLSIACASAACRLAEARWRGRGRSPTPARRVDRSGAWRAVTIMDWAWCGFYLPTLAWGQDRSTAGRTVPTDPGPLRGSQVLFATTEDGLLTLDCMVPGATAATRVPYTIRAQLPGSGVPPRVRRWVDADAPTTISLRERRGLPVARVRRGLCYVDRVLEAG